MGEINDFQKECYQVASEHGFWAGMSSYPIGLIIGQKLALIHSEVSEALEELRKNQLFSLIYYREDGKPEGFRFELADAVIRIFDLAEWCGVDMESAMREKMEFNKTRPLKHNKAF